MRPTKGLLSTILAVLLVGGATAAGGGTTAGKLTPASARIEIGASLKAAKSISGSIAETDPALLGRTDSTEIGVLVKYDLDATASYTGGVAGLEATSPAVTGKKLTANRNAVSAYERHAGAVADRISAAVEKAVPSAEIDQTFTTVYGGVAATVPADKVAALLAVDGVVAVQGDNVEQPETSVTPAFLGAPAVWDELGGRDRAGEGVVVGVLDTGVWPEHPSFADDGLAAPPGGPYACEFGDGTDVAHLGAPFHCNDKLIGAYAFLDTYMALIGAGAEEFCNDATGECSVRDAEGHGTHTATTAAGAHVEDAPIFGLDRGPVDGIAPGAHVIAYRVCAEAGCFNSDSIDAIQQAIADGVDVINYSISGGASPYTDPVELTFLDAFNAGISVTTSAGNSGPEAGTVNHGAPWVTTVGASTSDRSFSSTLTLGDGPATFNMPGVTIFPTGPKATPVVLASSIPGYNAVCDGPAPVGSAIGKVVACERGVIGRVEKSWNLLPSGAAAMLLYNPEMQDVETDNFWLPTIHVNGPKSELVAFLTAHPSATASWGGGVASPTEADVMAFFSSRGPQADFIKPDVTAPGIEILAGHTPKPAGFVGGPPGQLFQALAGTSMSSPHAAGVAALVKAAHPEWTPAMIKSALMTSAVTDVLQEDYETPATPFDDGAGSIRADRAVAPTLVFDETFEDFLASANDPLHRIDLNIASVNAPTMTGTITTKRTALNVSGSDQLLEVSTEAPPGTTILVSDRAPDRRGRLRGDRWIHVKRNGTAELWIQISAPDLADGQYFGEITLDPKGRDANAVVIPVAFFRTQGDVTLTHTCSPTNFPAKTGSAHCTATAENLASVEADVELKVTNLDRGRGLDFTNVSAPATSIRKGDGVLWNGTLSPSLPPAIDGIVPTTGPAGGYVPLASFPGSLVVANADDTITNLNVSPSFYFGGEAYAQVGIVSNGYVVLGGGDTADVVFLPQTFPNPALPNNVIAPLWTDLTPAGGGGAGTILVNALTDGVSTWLVIDYAGVKNYSNATTHTFQIWIRLATGPAGTGPESEQITITYGDANTATPDPGSGGNSGAENSGGTSGANLTTPADDTEWLVESSPPQSGGSATIAYDASAGKPGTYRVVAGMTSNVTPGITQVVQALTVEPGPAPPKPPKPPKPHKHHKYKAFKYKLFKHHLHKALKGFNAAKPPKRR